MVQPLRSNTGTGALSEHSAARRMIHSLVANGVTHFFGIPGGPAAALFEAVRLTSGARMIESRHENHAAFAAAAYYRASGKLAVVLTTAGPGIANAAAGIIAAHLERTPLLVVTGDVPWTSGQLLLQDSGPQGVGIETIYLHATRRIERIHHGRAAVSQCIGALNAALNPQAPGPAIVILPLDVARHEVDPHVARLSTLRIEHEIPEADVAMASELLSHAKRPLLVVGGACRPFAGAVRELAERLHLPFATTPRAKGALSETHPLSLRNCGLAASRWARAYTSEGVDVCLALGTDLDDCSVGPTPLVADDGALIHVDTQPQVLGRNLACTLAIPASIDAFCRALTAHRVEACACAREREQNLEARACAREQNRDDAPRPPLADREASLRRSKAASPFEREDFATHEARLLHPARAIADLEAALPRPRRVISDIGGHMLFAFHYLTIEEGDRFDIQFNLGSMGSGIAGAIGCALADVSRPVLCICGDGGMQMSGMEVLVARKLALPIIYAVFNDGRYNIVHHGMKHLFGASEAWDMGRVDFRAWAESMDIRGASIVRGGQIRTELLVELTRGFTAPCVLDIRVDPEQSVRGAGRAEALEQMGAGEQGRRG